MPQVDLSDIEWAIIVRHRQDQIKRAAIAEGWRQAADEVEKIQKAAEAKNLTDEPCVNSNTVVLLNSVVRRLRAHTPSFLEPFKCPD